MSPEWHAVILMYTGAFWFLFAPSPMKLAHYFPQVYRLAVQRFFPWLAAVLASGLLVSAWAASSDHLQRSVDLMRRGDLEGAAKAAEQALQDPATKPVALAALGTIRVQQQKLEEGRGLLEKALQLNPELLGARLSLGQVYLVLGEPAKAIPLYRDVLRKDADSVNARLGLVDAEAQVGNYRESLQLAEPLLDSLKTTSEGLMLLARIYAGLGDEARARQVAADWNRLSPGPEKELTMRMALFLAQKKLSDPAIKILEHLKSQHGLSHEVAVNLAGIHVLAGDDDKASEYYDAAVALNDDCVPCYRQVAVLAEKDGKLDKALAALIQAKVRDPENPEVLYEFGKVCFRRDLLKDAIDALEKAVAARPDNGSYRYALASALVGAGRREEARQLLETLLERVSLERRPDDAQLHYALGAVLYLDTQLEAAAEHLEQSVLLRPNQIASHYYLGLVHEKKGETEEAIRVFQALLDQHPEHGPSYEGLGAALFRARRYEEARKAFEKAIELNPSSVKSHYQLGLLLRRLGEQQLAAQQFEIAKKLREEHEENEVRLELLNPH